MEERCHPKETRKSRWFRTLGSMNLGRMNLRSDALQPILSIKPPLRTTGLCPTLRPHAPKLHLGMSNIYYIKTRTVCVCLCPARSREWNVILPHTFCQCKELFLVSCTNCLMSSLLKHKVVNAPFAFLCGFNILCTKPRPLCSTYDVTS